jgi:hypothetical protein
MGHASFHIRKDQGKGAWVVEEEDNHQIGGFFATLVAALDFVDGEARCFQQARAVIDFAPRAARQRAGVSDVSRAGSVSGAGRIGGLTTSYRAASSR